MTTLSGARRGRRSGILAPKRERGRPARSWRSKASPDAGPGGPWSECWRLSQAETAGDNAAQDFAGAALDRDFWRDQRCVAQRFLEAIVVAVGCRIAGRRGHQAGPVRQSLLPVRAEILDGGGLDPRGFSG